MNPAVPLLATKSVTASRPAGDGSRKPVIKATTLDVAAGECLAIIGPSGSGKSTFLRLLNRLLEPDSGSVSLAGTDIRTIEPPQLRSRLPLVAQKPFIFPGTVRDNLEASARLRRVPPPDLTAADVAALLAMCRIEADWIGRDAKKLSIGQQQRVCLARAMLGPCQALLLDEPTSALDRPTADRLAGTFRQLCREKQLAAVIVTHDLRIAELCADRVAFMQDGAVIEEGDADTMLSDPSTESARRFLFQEPAEGDGDAA